MRRLGGGGEDGAVIGFQQLQVLDEVLGVIGAGLTGDAEGGADESGGQFGDEFFGGVGLATEPAGQVAVEAVFGTTPVAELMGEGGGIIVGAVAGWRVKEPGFVGHLDAVWSGHVEGFSATVRDAGGGGGDERIEALIADDGSVVGDSGRGGAIIDLIDVEDGAGARDAAFAVVVGIIGIGRGCELLVEDHRAGPLAFANLGSELGPLAVGAPQRARIAAGGGTDPEGDGIDAAIGVAGVGVLRQVQRAVAGAMPGHLPGAGIGFDASDDLAGDGFVNGWFLGHGALHRRRPYGGHDARCQRDPKGRCPTPRSGPAGTDLLVERP